MAVKNMFHQTHVVWLAKKNILRFQNWRYYIRLPSVGRANVMKQTEAPTVRLIRTWIDLSLSLCLSLSLSEAPWKLYGKNVFNCLTKKNENLVAVWVGPSHLGIGRNHAWAPCLLAETIYACGNLWNLSTNIILQIPVNPNSCSSCHLLSCAFQES